MNEIVIEIRAWIVVFLVFTTIFSTTLVLTMISKEKWTKPLTVQEKINLINEIKPLCDLQWEKAVYSEYLEEASCR